jgi:hypothetical protein
MAFGMMPAMHPRMRDGQVLAAPGRFGKNYGSMVPAGVLMLHIIFGVVLGILYSPTWRDEDRIQPIGRAEGRVWCAAGSKVG